MNDVEILLDSWCSETNSRITTFRAQTPEWGFKDYVRHSALTALSVSSTRAETMPKARQRVLTNPAIPEVFQRNAVGMVGAGPVNDETQERARKLFLDAAHSAAVHHERAEALHLSKQDSNVLISAYLPTCFICTATEWNNFFTLRTAPDVKPAVLDLATKMRELYRTSQPQSLTTGEWHLPLISPTDWEGLSGLPRGAALARLKRASAARCAQQSYPGSEPKPLDAAVEMCDTVLLAQRHLSPLWHPACALDARAVCGPFVGFRPFRKEISDESGGDYANLWDPISEFLEAVRAEGLLTDELQTAAWRWCCARRLAFGAPVLGAIA